MTQRFSSSFPALLFDEPIQRVLRITISNPGRANALTRQMHTELTAVWHVVNADEQVRVVLLRGDGQHFCSGGDFSMMEANQRSWRDRIETLSEARDLVSNMTDCTKPVVAAVTGAAYGSGLALAVMADLAVVADDAELMDGHVRLGVAAGDHAAAVWPLLIGLAKAKRYLLASEKLSGAEAERLGLVSHCVPQAEVETTSLRLCDELRLGPSYALQWTKRALNHWIRANGPTFDVSAAYEFLGFDGPDFAEGYSALRARRPPVFHPADEPGQAGDR